MESQWHWNHEGLVFGPVSTPELERLIESGQVGGSDFVRLVGSEAWISAAEVRAMFHQPVAAIEGDSSSDKAARVLAEVDVARLRHRVDGTNSGSSGSRLLRLLSYGFSFAGACLKNIGAFFLDRLSFVPRLMRRKATLAVFALLIAAVLLRGVAFRSSLNETAIERMSAVWEQVDQLQGREASSGDWTEFRQRALETLTPVQRELEDVARENPRDPKHYWTRSGFRDAAVRSHLIQAGLVLREIVSTQGGSEGSRRNFQQKLELAHRQMTMAPPAATAARGRTEPTSRADSWDPLIVAILIIDGALVAGVAYWFLHRLHARA